MIERLIDGSSALWPAVATHLWQSTLVLLVLAVVARALRGAPARLLTLFLWVALLKLFLPLHWIGRFGEGVLTAVRSRLFADPAAVADWGAVRVWFYPEVLQVTATGGQPVWSTLLPVLTVGWMLGAAFLLLWPLGIRRTVPDVLTCPADKHGSARRRLEAALEGTSIPTGSVQLSELPEMPHVRGWLRPRIQVSRAAIEGLEIGDLRAVLLHEDAHRRRRDPLRFLALRFAAALLFYYPPVWWLTRRIRETTEMACDEAALAAGLSADEYAGSLARTLRLGLAQAGPATAIHGRRSSLKQRFARLSGNRRFVTMKRHRIALAAAVLLVAAASFAPIIPSAGEEGDSTTSVQSVRLAGIEGLEHTVDLNFKDTRLVTVLDTLGRRAGFDVNIGEKVRNERISLRLDDVSVGQALAIVAQKAGLAYSVPKPGTLLAERAGPLLAGVGDVTNPRLIADSKVDPKYPESMRAAGIEGSVILQAVIDETGNVGELSVLNATPKDQEELVASALDAVRQWRYEPATREGKPVAVYFTIFIDYSLR